MRPFVETAAAAIRDCDVSGLDTSAAEIQNVSITPNENVEVQQGTTRAFTAEVVAGDVYKRQVLLSGSTYYLSSVYKMMFMWGMMVIPLITMKSMSEDRKNRTDQMLLTSQVGLYSLVAGKFLAALTVYAIGLARCV